MYHGESHRTCYERMMEHWEGLRDQTEESVLTRHWREDHQGRDMVPEFSVKVVAKCKTSTERQLRESLLIEQETS